MYVTLVVAVIGSGKVSQIADVKYLRQIFVAQLALLASKDMGVLMSTSKKVPAKKRPARRAIKNAKEARISEKSVGERLSEESLEFSQTRGDMKTDIESLVETLDWRDPTIDKDLVLSLDEDSGRKTKLVLFKVKELSEASASEYRSAMVNVFSGVAHSNTTFLYILSGNEDHFSLHIGIAHEEDEASSRVGDSLSGFVGHPIGRVQQSARSKDKVESIHKDGAYDKAERLRSSILGNLMGTKLSGIEESERELSGLNDAISKSHFFGAFTGVPTLNKESSSDENEYQGVERLANSLSGENWQVVISAHAASPDEVNEIIEEIYDLSTTLSIYKNETLQLGENASEDKGRSKSSSKSKSENTTRGENITRSGSTLSSSNNTSESIGKSEDESRTETFGSSIGSSKSRSYEKTDQRVSEWHKYLSETVLERFRLGASKGLFRSTMYIGAESKAVYTRLASGVISIFQGDVSTMTPLKDHHLSGGRLGNSDLTLENFAALSRSPRNVLPKPFFVANSIPLLPQQQYAFGSWMNSHEMALMAGFPSKELPGIPVRKTVEFGLNCDQGGNDFEGRVSVGKIKQHGRSLSSSVSIPKKVLSSHVFVTGVTGSGKTTTCMKILLESGLNFLVIEPAKTEYRALSAYSTKGGDPIEYYSLNREDLSIFRFNPFEVISPTLSLSSHIQILNSTLTAVFPMEASMPYMVEEAIIAAYEEKGWDVHSGENYLVSDPWGEDSSPWPTFSTMIESLRKVIKSKGLGKEFEEKYEGSLVSRLSNLTKGTKGKMLNCQKSIDIEAFLDKKVVLELDDLKDEKDKALLMGLMLTRLSDCVRLRHKKDPGFQHLTLIEEAHRLLSNPAPSDTEARRHGVEMFANLLAEVRKYGAGLVIADQIPAKLIPDVIKNTNTKIVHRLFAADDRKAMGDAMGLCDEQSDFLPKLQPGETVIYKGGWHNAVWALVDRMVETDSAEISEDEIRQCGVRQFNRDVRSLYPRFFKATQDVKKEDLMGVYRISDKTIGAVSRAFDVALNGGDYQKENQLPLLSNYISKRGCEINEIYSGGALLSVISLMEDYGLVAKSGSARHRIKDAIHPLLEGDIDDFYKVLSNGPIKAAVKEAVKVFSDNH